MSALGMTKQQELSLDQQLSVGGLRNNGKLINAALHNGFVTSFQGSYFTDVGGIDQARTALDAAKVPYTVQGVSQLLHVTVTSTTAGAGFPDAAAAGDTGVLRLTNADTNTTKLATGLFQNNALWIAPSTSFSVIYDIKQWTQRSDAIATQWAEIGVAGSSTAASMIDSDLFPGYVDNTNDASFAVVKLGASQGRVIYKALNTGAATTYSTSPAFDLPTGAFTIRMDYNAASSGGSPGLAIYVNDVFKVLVSTSLAGPFQLYARTCHSATYASGTQAPTILDIDAIAVALPV